MFSIVWSHVSFTDCWKGWLLGVGLHPPAYLTTSSLPQREQTLLRLLCSLQVSSSSAQLKRARTTLGVSIHCFFLLLCSSTITEATRGRVYLGSWSRVIRAHHHHGREGWQQADTVAEPLRAHISKGKKQRAHWEWHRLLKPPSPPLVKLFPTRLPCCLLGPLRQLYQARD